MLSPLEVNGTGETKWCNPALSLGVEIHWNWNILDLWFIFLVYFSYFLPSAFRVNSHFYNSVNYKTINKTQSMDNKARVNKAKVAHPSGVSPGHPLRNSASSQQGNSPESLPTYFYQLEWKIIMKSAKQMRVLGVNLQWRYVRKFIQVYSFKILGHFLINSISIISISATLNLPQIAPIHAFDHFSYSPIGLKQMHTYFLIMSQTNKYSVNIFYA